LLTDVATSTAKSASAMYESTNSPKTPSCIARTVAMIGLPCWKWW